MAKMLEQIVETAELVELYNEIVDMMRESEVANPMNVSGGIGEVFGRETAKSIIANL